MAKKSEILFEKEIVSNAATQLGLSESLVNHHLIFMKKYIEELMNRDDVHSIHLPHVGIMYRNIKACAFTAIYLGVFKNITEKRQALIDKCKRDIEYLLEELKSFENLSLHNYRRRLNNPYFTCKMKKYELEKFQNEE